MNKFDMLLALLFVFSVWCNVAEGAPTSGDDESNEPYTIMHVHLEEGAADALDSRRQWDDAKAEKKRVAEIVEGEQRMFAKLDAVLAAQAVQSNRLLDLTAAMKSLRNKESMSVKPSKSTSFLGTKVLPVDGYKIRNSLFLTQLMRSPAPAYVNVVMREDTPRLFEQAKYKSMQGKTARKEKLFERELSAMASSIK